MPSIFIFSCPLRKLQPGHRRYRVSWTNVQLWNVHQQSHLPLKREPSMEWSWRVNKRTPRTPTAQVMDEGGIIFCTGVNISWRTGKPTYVSSDHRWWEMKGGAARHIRRRLGSFCVQMVLGCSAKLPGTGTCLHNYLHDARLRLGGCRMLAEEKITTCTRATGSR